MKRLAMHTVAVACLAAAAGQASATATSSAFASNMTISLSSLNPTDGSTPWLTFAPSQPPTVHNDVSGWGDTFENYSSDDYASGAKQNGVLARDLKTDWSHASSSVTTAANAAGYTAMAAQGAANSGLDGYGSYFNLASTGSAQNYFVLSPMSRITFSVTADLKSFTSMGYNLDADMPEFALARAALTVGGKVDGIEQVDGVEQAIWSYYYVNDDNTVTGENKDWSGTLSVSFVNYGSTATEVWTQGYVATEGYSAVWDGVTPVPEPSAYAMMLGGLGLMGAAARRRSKAA